jgi:hypothetical protein
MSPMAKIVDWVKGSLQVANTTEKFAPGSPGSGTRRGFFDTRAHRLALAEGYGVVEDTGGEASARGIGYVRKGDGIESKAAQVDSSDLGAREVGRRGNIHDILVVAVLGGENLRVREFEGAMNKFENFLTESSQFPSRCGRGVLGFSKIQYETPATNWNHPRTMCRRSRTIPVPRR